MAHSPMRFLLLPLLITTAGSIYGQIEPEWVARYTIEDTLYSQTCEDMAVDAEGNVFVTGFAEGWLPGRKAVLLKYADDGSLLWERPVLAVHGLIQPMRIQLDGEGNAFLMYSYIDDSTGYDFLFTKYSSSGDSLLSGRFTLPPSPSWDKPNAFVIDVFGNIHMTGERDYVAPGNEFDMLTVMFDATGQEVWHASYDGGADAVERAFGIATDGESNTYVAGTSPDGQDSAIVVLKYDPNGNLVWERRHLGYNFSYGRDIQLTNQGTVVVDCHLTTPDTTDWLYWGFTPEGDPIFETQFTAPFQWNTFEQMQDTEIDGDGNIYSTGWQGAPDAGYYDFSTVKLASDGSELWAQRYDGGLGWDRSYAVDVDDFGNVYGFGDSRDTLLNTTVMLTIKRSGDGDILWLAKYALGTDASYLATDAELAPDGSYYAAATELHPDGSNLLLLKYSATVGISTMGRSSMLAPFPNPALNQYTVDLRDHRGAVWLSLTDLSGRTVQQESVQGGQFVSVNRGRISGGAYVLRAVDSDGRSTSGILVLE